MNDLKIGIIGMGVGTTHAKIAAQFPEISVSKKRKVSFENNFLQDLKQRLCFFLASMIRIIEALIYRTGPTY